MADPTANEAQRRPRVRRTSRRVGWAFAAVLLLFAGAMVMSIRTHAKTSEAMREIAHLDHAKHTGHYAAALISEQYIHQAHIIIRWSRDHMPKYETAAKTARAAAERLFGFAHDENERELATQIARLAAQSDTAFRRGILADLARDDRSAIQQRHDELEHLVSRVVEYNDELNALFEARSANARAAADDLRRDARIILIGCFALAIMLSAIVSVQIVRSIAHPIAALRAGAQRIGSGDLDTRIEVATDDEFGELADTFNQMSADLSNHQAQLVRSQRLASIGRLGAGVAHEINNPLSVILGYVKLLQRDDRLRDNEDLQIIEVETRQCQHIVQSLLELSRVPKLELEHVDVSALAHDAIARLEEAGKLDGLDVTTPNGADAATITADEAKLRQVVANLLVNAAEATPRGGRIDVRVSEDRDGVALSIKDTGSGIADDVRSQLFQPFFTTKPEGTGLGLAIAQGIVDAHGGSLEIESEPDRGTEVTLWLPKQPASSSRTTKKTS